MCKQSFPIFCIWNASLQYQLVNHFSVSCGSSPESFNEEEKSMFLVPAVPVSSSNSGTMGRASEFDLML